MIETTGLSGAQALLHVLERMGVDRIFASPGSEWSPVWEALAEADANARGAPAYLSARHEEIAVAMASGYAKASGKLPAVMIHTTVGALHASMALRAALHEQIPMVVFAGESVGFGEDEGPDPSAWWLGQLADIGGPARLVERCVKWSFALNTPSIFPSTIQRACQLATAMPRGPVFVSVPMEYLFRKMTHDAPSACEIAPAPAADPAAVEQLAELLAGANNPVIVAEYAGRSVRVVSQTIALAELLGAPVVETGSTGYLNFPRDHALHGGYEPREYLAEADAVLLLGAIAPWHPASRGPRASAKVAVLDENPLRTDLPYWGFRTDLCLAGGIDTSLEQLLDRLAKRMREPHPSIGERADAWRARHLERRRQWRQEALGAAAKTPLDTRFVLHELNEIVPGDAMIVEETITHRLAVHRHLDRVKPGAYFAGCIGGLGTGLGTALGVKAAAPHRPVICLIGDGSFNYDPALAALGFSQEHRMPILVVLFNNSGYLSQKSGIPRNFPQGWAVKTSRFIGTSIAPSPDYAMIARAFDGHGERVEDPAEARGALERGLQAISEGRLALLDMRLEPVNR
jgi:acetolactate synthase-1/2/3 large subunit